MDLLPRVAATIEAHDLLPAGIPVVVAVSGGADSLSLLDILCRLSHEHDWNLLVATFDHAWRPESAIEAQIVSEHVRGLGRECIVHRADQPWRDEAGARRQRHEFFNRVADGLGPEVRIAVGHNADDRVETMLLNLLRGCGLTGLGAMPACAGRVVRPLIDCRREELRIHAAEQGLPVREDPSNLDRRYDRNRLRLDVIPMLEQFRPGAAAAMSRASSICGDEREALRRYGELLLEKRLNEPGPGSFLAGLRVQVIDLWGWEHEPAPERTLLLRELLRRHRGHLTDASAAAVSALDDFAGGRPDASPLRLPSAFGDAVAVHWRGRMVFGSVPLWGDWGPYLVQPDRATEIPETGVRIVLGEEARACELQARVTPLPMYMVRPRRIGDDWITPVGRGGRRKLSDLLLEYEVPRIVRDRVPVLAHGEHVAWVPGGPPDVRFADPHGLRIGIEFAVVS